MNYKLLSLLLGLIAIFSSCVNQWKGPNVILIMTDDQGYGDMSSTGNPILKTPNLDKLYSQSVRFTNFHVNSFCAPTRAALMTGRFSDRTHVRSTVYMRNHLNREETTIAEYFKASGYKTGMFGKWHLGENYPYRPMDRGFDTWVGLGDGGLGTASDFWENDRMNDTYFKNGIPEKIEGFGNDVFFEESFNFIRNNKENPFFIYLATNIPHGPMTIRDEWRHKFDTLNLPGSSPWGDTADLFATLERFDYNLGRLREVLSKNDLDDNTILIFLTDNGTANGHHIYNANMRGNKGSLYEGGHRVPLFFHIPGKESIEKDIDKLTLHVDILPTLIDICDLKAPNKTLKPLDGKNLNHLIVKTEENWKDRTFIEHVQNIIENPVKGRNILVATENWRLIQGKELYDIKKDPSQQNNIANEFPDVVKDLNFRYNAYWDELNMMNQPYPRPIIGTTIQDEVWLNTISIIRDEGVPHSWNQRHVREAAQSSGFWPVEFVDTDEYTFEVRRWPKEADLGILDSIPLANKGDITMLGKPFLWERGEAINVDSISIEIDGKVLIQKVKEGQKAVEFNYQVEKGNAQIRAWFHTKKGDKFGAYYVYVRKG